MAKKLNKVSVAAWERIAKECAGAPVAVVDWHGEQLEVRRRLGLAEMAALVNFVVKDCFSEDSAEYRPELREFATARAFIFFYSNLTPPVNTEKQYDLIGGTDIYETVLRVVDQAQYSEIMNAIDEKIDALLDANVSSVNKQLERISAAVDEMAQIFDGIDKSDLEKFLGSIDQGSLSPERLMSAYFTEKAGEDEQS